MLTNFWIPKLQAAVVSRPEIFNELDKGLNCKLTIITAPAGYGKTTAVSEWIVKRKEPTVWITLNKEANHGLRFWHEVIEAIKKTVPSFKMAEVESFVNSEEELLGKLVNQLTEPIIIAFDDFYLLENKKILNGISTLLKHMSGVVHLYIISRVTPTLRLSKLRLNGDLNELKKECFVFERRELNILCDDVLSITLSNEEKEGILTRTEGWITGIKLALQIVQNNNQQSNRLEKLCGTNHKITTYFFEEVFEQQSELIQQFLLQTSILTHFNDSLSDATIEVIDGDLLFQTTIHEEIFVTVSGGKGWYRYHPLFQEFLIAQLKERTTEELVRHLHVNAGLWFVENSYEAEAFIHFIEGESYGRALLLLEKLFPRLLEGEKNSLWTYMDKIPNELIITKPNLYLMHIAFLFCTGKRQEASEKYWWAK